MSLEEQWANRKEWENERGELELNQKKAAAPMEICCQKKCNAPAKTMYEIVLAGHANSGIEINLCEDHDDEDTAFALYRYYADPGE